MKRLFVLIAFLAISESANAQTKLFDFPLNNMRIEAGLNIGQVATFSEYARYTFGANLMVAGVYLDQQGAHQDHSLL